MNARGAEYLRVLDRIDSEEGVGGLWKEWEGEPEVEARSDDNDEAVAGYWSAWGGESPSTTVAGAEPSATGV